MDAFGYWRSRNLTAAAQSVSAGRTVRRNTGPLQYSVPSRGLGGSVEVRPPLPDGSIFGSARTRADDGESLSLPPMSPANRRGGAPRAATAGQWARSQRPASISRGRRLLPVLGSIGEACSATGVPRTGGAQRRGAHDARRIRLEAARCRPREAEVVVPLRRRSPAPVPQPLLAGACQLSTSCRPFRAGADATAANPDLELPTASGPSGHRLCERAVQPFADRVREPC